MDAEHIDYLIKQLEALKTAETIVYNHGGYKRSNYVKKHKSFAEMTEDQREKARKRCREYAQNLPEEKKKERAVKAKKRYETDEAYRNRILESTRKKNEIQKEKRRLARLEREATKENN